MHFPTCHVTLNWFLTGITKCFNSVYLEPILTHMGSSCFGGFDDEGIFEWKSVSVSSFFVNFIWDSLILDSISRSILLLLFKLRYKVLTSSCIFCSCLSSWVALYASYSLRWRKLKSFLRILNWLDKLKFT